MAQRSRCALALFLVGLIPIGLIVLSYIPIIINYFSEAAGIYGAPMIMTTVLMMLIIWVVYILGFLLFMVMQVNLSGTFVNVYYGQQISSTDPFKALRHNFGRKLGGMCWESLWLYLWSLAIFLPGLILIVILLTIFASQSSSGQMEALMLGLMYVMMIPLYIPLVIKMLQYSMTSFVLACNPNVTATKALKLSIEMTRGHKGKIFMMALSFFGWWILSFFTLHILGFLYVYPYTYASFAGLFVELRNHAVAKGVIHPAELDGVAAYYPQYPQYPQYPHQEQYSYIKQYLQQQPPEAPHG